MQNLNPIEESKDWN